MQKLSIGVTALLIAGCSVVGRAPSPPDSISPGSSASPADSPAPWLPPPVPTIAGHHVFSVSEAISARDGGTLGSQSIDLGGYWSDNPVPLSCPAPMHDPSPLEMWCSDGFGITERFETAVVIRSNGVETSFTGPDGPMLMPYVASDIRSRLSPTTPIGPVPVVVAGHFDDAQAANCAADARESCRKTFVIDSVLVYDPSSAPTPPPTPIATLIPPSAPGLFDKARCAGDVSYSFVGWTTADMLDAAMDFQGQAWAMVTKDVVPLGEWNPDANVPGHYNLAMGRRVCLGFPLDEAGGVAYSVVKGTAYRLWDDGRRTASDEMGDGSGDPDYPPAGAAPPLPNGVTASMSGKGLPDLAATIYDWTGEMLSARPATTEELALPGSETRSGSNAAALVLPDGPRSVLVVMAECGSDQTVTVTVTADRAVVLLMAGDRTDCAKPGARRGAVLTFQSAVPSEIQAITGL